MRFFNREHSKKRVDGRPVCVSDKESKTHGSGWYLSEEGERYYSSASPSAKLEHLSSYLHALADENHNALFCEAFGRDDRGKQFAELLLIAMIPSSGLPFSGYYNALSEETNPVISYFCHSRYLLYSNDKVINDLIRLVGKTEVREEESAKELLFVKRCILSVFAEADTLPYAFRVENPGFFLETKEAVTGETAVIIPKKNGFDPRRVRLGKKYGEDVSYYFQSKPILLLHCEDSSKRREVYSHIIRQAVGNGNYDDLKLILFDYSGSSFLPEHKDFPNLYWPVVTQALLCESMLGKLDELVSKRSNMTEPHRPCIWVLCDDLRKLYEPRGKSLLRLITRAADADAFFIYPFCEDSAPVTELIPYCDLAYTEELEISNDEQSIVATADTSSYPRYDDAYYEVFRKYKGRWHYSLAVNDNEDPLYYDAVRYAIKQQSVSTSLLQREFRIGFMRAAELILKMENEGIISKADGKNPRAVLVENDEYID